MAEGNETIEVNGQKRHVMSYLGDFLFSPQRVLTPVKALSGGECNRLLLARLFSRPSNLLVLDEPTNDLDIETLELLEELLSHYQGTLLIVSHDRSFLDNVATSTLLFEGNGKITEYIGGYQETVQQAKQKKAATPKITIEKAVKNKPRSVAKLSYKEQKELEELPERIMTLETRQTELQQRSATPEFYQKNPAEITDTLNELQKIEKDLEAAYQRWEWLENK